jgi:hypothetical protein
LHSSYAVFDLTNNQISLANRNFSSTTDNVVAVPAKGVKALASSTTTPSSTGTGTATGTATSATATKKKSSASALSFPGYLIGISLIGVVSLGTLF